MGQKRVRKRSRKRERVQWYSIKGQIKKGKREGKSKVIKSELEVIGDWVDEKCHRHKIILELVWPYGVDEYRCRPAGSLARGSRLI